MRGGNEARRLEKVMVAATDTTCKAAIKPEIFGTIPCLAHWNIFCSKLVKLQHSHAGKYWSAELSAVYSTARQRGRGGEVREEGGGGSN